MTAIEWALRRHRQLTWTPSCFSWGEEWFLLPGARVCSKFLLVLAMLPLLALADVWLLRSGHAG